MGYSKAEELYRAQVSFFERPIVSNKPYKYETLHVGSPYDFYLQVIDPTADPNEAAKLVALLQGHLDELKSKAAAGGGGSEEGDKDILPPKLTDDLFYEGMPLLVKMKDKEGLKIEELLRGEVIKIKDGQRQVVDVLLVDQGTVLEDLKWECDLLPVTRDILRVPKLGISCTLAMISPEGGDTWPKDRDWEKDFLGESQEVTFLDYYPDSKSYEVAVEVNKVNIALKYFHTAVAQPIPLANFEQEGGQVAGRFPVADYTGWVGLKVISYGMKVFRDEGDGNKFKCAVQIQPDIVNDVQGKIEEYLKTASDAVKGEPFDKKVGSFCLAKFGEEYFRSTILKKEEDKYLVEYVDYKDKQLVGEKDMIKLPESMQTIQEGGVICQITDLMCAADYNDLDKLKKLLENQDLYAVVDACDATLFGSELLVSFYLPTPAFDGSDASLADILELPKSNRPPLVQEILQTMEIIPETWQSIFLQPPTLIPNQVYEFKVVSTGESSDPWDSIVVHCNEKGETKESTLTLFYENNGCDPEIREAFMQSGNVTGCWVAAKATPPAGGQGDELEEGEIREEDAQNGWLRAKVVQDKTAEEKGKIKILYVDYGITAWVEKYEVLPLHKYFCKDPLKIVKLMQKKEEDGKFFN